MRACRWSRGVVERPAGVTLFPSDDVQELRSTIQRLLYRSRAGVGAPKPSRPTLLLGASFSERRLGLYVSDLGPDVRLPPAPCGDAAADWVVSG